MVFKRLTINKKLLLIKIHYFLWNGGISTIQPNLSSYARQLGFSSVIVGFLFTAMPIMSLIFRPLLGIIADKYQRQKMLFVGSQMFLLVSILGIFLTPTLNNYQPVVKLQCDVNNKNVLKVASATTSSNCTFVDYVKNNVTDVKFLYYEYNTTLTELTVSLIVDQLITKQGVLEVPVKEIKEDGNKSISWCNKSNSYNLYSHDSRWIKNYIEYPEISNEEITKQYWCWLFFLFMVLFHVLYSIVSSLGDAICFALLEDQPSHYGQQRLFGALGWGIFSVFSGFISDVMTDGKPNIDYSICFYTTFILIFINIMVCMKIKFTQRKASSHFYRDVGQFFLSAKNNVFFLWCASIGICGALIWQFLYWLIEDLLNGVDCKLQYYLKTLEGLVQFIETIFGEIPFFFISGWLMKKLGHTNVMSIVIFCFGIRIALYSVISNPWWFLPVELMNGIDFGLCFSCMASYASIIAPEGTEATAQSLVGAFYEGIGNCIGNSVAGISYKDNGGIKTFRYFAYFALTASLLHVIAQVIFEFKRKLTVKK